MRLDAAARQLARRGVEPVRAEDSTAEAVVPRATMYEYLYNKYRLVGNIVNPECDPAGSLHLLCARPAAEALDGIVDVYCLRWTTHRDALNLIALVDSETFAHLEQRHG